MGKKIPDGWLKYQPLGRRIEGTKFIAFKVPLRNTIVRQLPEEQWFTPSILFEKVPKLKMVVDLTYTKRYYAPQEFVDRGIDHVKIYVEGGGNVPPPAKLREFFEVADKFLAKYSTDPDALIGVHCTHGLNRTGYFICSYMIQRLKMSSTEAIRKFEAARGHVMERQRLVEKIKSLDAENARVTPRYDYVSPLENFYSDSYDTNRRYVRPNPSRENGNWRNRNYDNWRDRSNHYQPY